jgi:hypothetical protein
MKININKLKEIIKEEVQKSLNEQNSGAVYKYLGLPDYLGNAPIGTGGVRNEKFLQDFTAELVTSKKFKGSVDEVDPKKLKMLVNAAKEFESRIGKKVAAVVISPSICGPGSHPDCVRGVCKKIKEIKFGASKGCEHMIGGDAALAPGEGVQSFIHFVATDNVGGPKEAPLGLTYSIVPVFKNGKIEFQPGGVIKTSNFLKSIDKLKRFMFDELEKKVQKSEEETEKRIYRGSPYGKAEKRCGEIFKPGVKPAPFGIIDSADNFGYGDDRVWRFKCLSSDEVELLNPDEVFSRMTKMGFAYTKEHSKCDQKTKKCPKP